LNLLIWAQTGCVLPCPTYYDPAPADEIIISLEANMGLGKQAKTLTRAQVDAILGYVNTTRHRVRNRAIVLLSVRAGMRAKEITSLTWDMVTDAQGEIGTAIHLQNRASKGRNGGRVIPLNTELRNALRDLKNHPQRGRPSPYVVTTERATKASAQTVVNLFFRWYHELGFKGCSSHSGRRTFITNAARKISTVGGSLRDVQMLAGHSNLATTQRYIEANGEAQQRIVELI
jgi:integrase/recombinase XerD